MFLIHRHREIVVNVLHLSITPEQEFHCEILANRSHLIGVVLVRDLLFLHFVVENGEPLLQNGFGPNHIGSGDLVLVEFEEHSTVVSRKYSFSIVIRVPTIGLSV